MISYYDAFGSSSFNNSERIAKALALKYEHDASPLRVTLCSLNTIYDKAFAQTEDCLKALPEKPLMIIGLGETGCELKLETMMKNNDRTVGPDNAGNRRENSLIIPDAPSHLGLRYPLPQMYCALSRAEKKSLVLSNYAGSFVCNNTAFQLSYYHPEIPSGFFHVPGSKCEDVQRRTESTILILEKMITRGANYLSSELIHEGLPHSDNDIRLPTRKSELKKLRKFYSGRDRCIHNYLKNTKGHDEKRGLFGLTN